MVSPSEYYLKKIEEKRNFKLPIFLFENESLKKIDEIILKKDPFLISKFCKEYRNYFDLTSIEKIDETLKKKRDSLSEEDKKLISNIINLGKTDPEFFFDIVGNLLFIENIAYDLDLKRANLTDNLLYSIFLFCYLNIIEIITFYLAELIKLIIIEKKEEKKYDNFLKRFQNLEHPEIGLCLNTIEKLNILTQEEIYNTIFSKNKIIRNKIAHANIYYNDKSKKIYLSNGTEIALEKFEEDFYRTLEFLYELIFQFTKGKDILNEIDNLFKEYSKIFLKIERSHLRKEFKNIVFEWEK